MLRHLWIQKLIFSLGFFGPLVIGASAFSSIASATECSQFRAEGIWQSLKTDKLFYIQQNDCTSATVTPLHSEAVTYNIRTDGATPSVMPRAFFASLANRKLDAIEGGTFTARLSGSTMAFDFNALLRPIEATLRRFVVRAVGTANATLASPQDTDFQGCVYANDNICDQPTVFRYIGLPRYIILERVQVLSIAGSVRQTQVSAPRALTAILQSFSRGRTFRAHRLEGLAGSDRLIRISDDRTSNLNRQVICNPREVARYRISRRCDGSRSINDTAPPAPRTGTTATGAE